MSTADLELIERAAKAAGHLHAMCYEADPAIDEPFAYAKIASRTYWRPLGDDGDALRLAVALAERLSRTGRVLCLSIGMNRSGCEFNFIDGPDQGANTRRAIVVAAATMTPKESP